LLAGVLIDERTYTVDEANAALPRVREAVERIQASRTIVLEHGERIREHAGTNGGGAEGGAYWNALASLRRDVEWLADEGIILRDADSGLIDFPSEREGRIVQLCWKIGEDRVAFWHEPDAGFSNRRPV
jgi:hypothetical protein